MLGFRVCGYFICIGKDVICMKHEKLYSVKEVLELCHITRTQLFYYEEKGLIKAVRDESNNYRYYDEKQITKLAFIVECREVGFSLNSIESMLACNNIRTIQHSIKQAMRDLRKDLDEYITKYEKSLERYNSMLEATYLINNQAENSVEIVEMPARNAVYYEYEGTFLNTPFEFYKKLAKLEDIIKKYNFCKLSPCMYQFENHFNPQTGEFECSSNKIRLFYEVKESHSNCPTFTHMKPARALSTIYIGDYDEKMIKTYQKILKYALENNISLSPVSIEECLLDTNIAYDNPGMWVTRINILIND